jgi:carboxymethylenebutenolidase
MGEHVTLTASDGHQLDAWVARPAAQPIAGLVIIQELFGVTAHIRSVTDGWAQEGFLTVAPALFDRVERGLELGYEPADMQKAVALLRQGNPDDRLKDVDAALDYARHESGGKKAGIVGYCFGGSMAWLAATRLHPDAAVGYYGSQISTYGAENPRAPVMLHFGTDDAHIPKDQIESKVAALHSEIPIFFYEGAGHAFNNDDRPSYNPAAAKLARSRSLEFLKQHLR